MQKPHYFIVKYTLIPENWSGMLEIKSEIDGSVVNNGKKNYFSKI